MTPILAHLERSPAIVEGSGDGVHDMARHGHVGDGGELDEAVDEVRDSWCLLC